MTCEPGELCRGPGPAAHEWAARSLRKQGASVSIGGGVGSGYPAAASFETLARQFRDGGPRGGQLPCRSRALADAASAPDRIQPAHTAPESTPRTSPLGLLSCKNVAAAARGRVLARGGSAEHYRLGTWPVCFVRPSTLSPWLEQRSTCSSPFGRSRRRSKPPTRRSPRSTGSSRPDPEPPRWPSSLVCQHLVNERDHQIADYVDGQIRKVQRPPRGPSGT